MSVKTFENNGKNISENIVKLKLERNIESLVYNHFVYICAKETDVWQFYGQLTRLTSHFDIDHS